MLKIVDLWGNSIEAPIDEVFGYNSLNKSKLMLINLIVSSPYDCERPEN